MFSQIAKEKNILPRAQWKKKTYKIPHLWNLRLKMMESKVSQDVQDQKQVKQGQTSLYLATEDLDNNL